ncbi:MAG: ABC transporter ATP-binding protein [Solirubrobacteraceae bacterium]|jgi:ABC-type multidrug transport system fused ATPase/permease subunit
MRQRAHSSSSTQQIRRLLGTRRLSVIALVVVSVVAGLTEAVILAIVAQAASALVAGSRGVHVTVGPLHLAVTVGAVVAIGFGMAFLRTVLQAPLSALPAQIMSDVQAALQRELFAAYSKASWTEQSRDREGHLQELMTNQVLQAAVGAISATSLVTAVLTLMVMIGSALLLNALAAAAVLVVVVLMFVALRPLNQLGVRQVRAMSAIQMRFASGVGEASRLAEETRVFGVADAQRDRVGSFVDELRTLSYRAQTLTRIGPNVYQSAIYMLVLGGLAALSATHAGHVASLGAVVLLLLRAGSYGQQVQGNYQALRSTLPFVERVQQVEQRYTASMPTSGDEPLGDVRSLTFEHVSFAYTAGVPVLSDISFTVGGGEAIGVIGPSGAGKSTLVQILLQLRAPDSGRYLVNGEPVGSFRIADWQSQVAYVPQEPQLLHASVADNIRYFRELDDSAVEEAARLARIDDDIASWADGYHTVIGPRADAISGGQQQRICIARALAATPTVLVLDEPTSALDPRSESLLQESLLALREQLTLFIVAHRMSTLDICDRVMVIVDGRLDAFDDAASLKRQDGYYHAALALSRPADDS